MKFLLIRKTIFHFDPDHPSGAAVSRSLVGKYAEGLPIYDYLLAGPLPIKKTVLLNQDGFLLYRSI